MTLKAPLAFKASALTIFASSEALHGKSLTVTTFQNHRQVWKQPPLTLVEEEAWKM